MVSVGGFPGRSPFTAPPAARRPQSLWAEVVERRKAWHAKDVDGSMESWEASDQKAWLGRLDDCTNVLEDSLTSPSDVDPRAALVDVIAVASAWADSMGERTT